LFKIQDYIHIILNTKHGDEKVPPTRSPGSSVIDYVYITEDLLEHVLGIGMISVDAIFNSDYRNFFLDNDIESFFGTELDNMPAPQFRKLQLDDLRIVEGYKKIPQKLFTTRNIYKRLQCIAMIGNKEDWTMEDENKYETIDRDIMRSMLSTANHCNLMKMHT
jgi:hypothetical protein